MPLFIRSNHPQLTADALLGLFKVKLWSPEGSNSRECEEAVIFNWQNYVQKTEGRGMSLYILLPIGHALKVVSMDNWFSVWIPGTVVGM